MLIAENRWRAMRYSFDKGLIDLGRGDVIPCPQLYEELLELIGEDAEALGCEAQVEHVRRILSRGTSAHRQLALFRQLRDEGLAKELVGPRIVQHLIAETGKGLGR